jgi:hypothetical protein
VEISSKAKREKQKSNLHFVLLIGKAIRLSNDQDKVAVMNHECC